MGINFFFNVKGDPANWNPGTMFFYNGDVNEIQGVHNPEELKYIEATYADCNDKGLKTYWWTNIAPVYVRIFGVLQPGSTDLYNDEIAKKIAYMKEKAKAYIEIYGDPTHFIPKIAVPIRADCTKTAEILGTAVINYKYKLSKTVTVCDYHWGAIEFNGKTAWITLGDITGETYGILEKHYFDEPPKEGPKNNNRPVPVVTQQLKPAYVANEVKFVAGIWQIKCDYLAPAAFDWVENGIPVSMVNWVDKDGIDIPDGADKDFKAGMCFSFDKDENNITDTGRGGYNYGWYWRLFRFGQFGLVWLSVWNKDDLVNHPKK